jgi:hypothetical protein
MLTVIRKSWTSLFQVLPLSINVAPRRPRWCSGIRTVSRRGIVLGRLRKLQRNVVCPLGQPWHACPWLCARDWWLLLQVWTGL